MGGQAPAGSANVAVGAAAVSLDGFIANDNTHPGPLFDWFGKGEVAWSLPGAEGGPQLPGLGRLHCAAGTATWRQASSAPPPTEDVDHARPLSQTRRGSRP